MQSDKQQIIDIMKSKALKSNNLRRKMVNENFIIRLDGETDLFGEILVINSAVGYEKANNIGGTKFQKIVDKAIKKGGDKCKLQINHKLNVTLYSR